MMKSPASGRALPICSARYAAIGVLASASLMLGALLVANPASVARASFVSPRLPDSPAIAGQLAPLSAAEAAKRNALIPISGDSGPAAAPFAAPAPGSDSAARSLECLTAAVHYEAAAEPIEAQRAVAQVVLNRVRHPAFPKSVCGVVFEGSERRTGCQFTFTCDGALRRQPGALAWSRAMAVARSALAGHVFAPVGLATHFHADYVLPYWASSMAKIDKFGITIFYRWRGRWGAPTAFTGRYSGVEPEAYRQAAENAAAAAGAVEPLESMPALVVAPAPATAAAPADDFGMLDYRVEQPSRIPMAERNVPLDQVLQSAQAGAAPPKPASMGSVTAIAQ